MSRMNISVAGGWWGGGAGVVQQYHFYPKYIRTGLSKKCRHRGQMHSVASDAGSTLFATHQFLDIHV